MEDSTEESDISMGSISYSPSNPRSSVCLLPMMLLPVTASISPQLFALHVAVSVMAGDSHGQKAMLLRMYSSTFSYRLVPGHGKLRTNHIHAHASTQPTKPTQAQLHTCNHNRPPTHMHAHARTLAHTYTYTCTYAHAHAHIHTNART